VVLVGFLAIFYLMGLFEFGNEPVIDGFSVKSSDELAELIIPKGALPGNVDQDDISVMRISNTFSAEESWIDYELKPDGLVFTKEILLNVRLDNENNAFPIVLISNGTGIDLVTNTLIEVDLETNTKTVSILLTHFSTIHIGHTGAIDLKLSAPDTMVDEQVDTTASFTLIQKKITKNWINANWITVVELLEPHIIYKGSWWIKNETYILSPYKGSIGKPSSTKVIVGQTNTVQDDFFKVEDEGTAQLVYQAEITVDAKFTFYDSESDYLEGNARSSTISRNRKIVFRKDLVFRCFAPELRIKSLILTYHENKPEFYMLIKIEGPANSTGIVTLTGFGMETMKQAVSIDPSGITYNDFTLSFRDEITILAEVGELTAERKFIPKSE
jgi:hypothetical protein